MRPDASAGAVLRARAALLALPAALMLWAGSAHAQQPGPVLVVGDSLEVGTGPHLKRELRGADVTVDARSGRPGREGLGVLRDLIRPAHRVVVFDLGTNDDPSEPRRLRATLAAARQAAGKRCLVVATLVRPTIDGVSVEAMNDVVERFASGSPNIRLADWRAQARRSPELIGSDRVHATPRGYAARARVVADAVRSCSKEGDESSAPSRRQRDESDPGARLAPLETDGILPALGARLPLDLPLGLLQGATGLVESALRQLEGAVVPIAPDAVLGRERDPLGKTEP